MSWPGERGEGCRRDRVHRRRAGGRAELMRPNRAVRGPTYVVWAEALEGETEATGPRLGPRDGALPCGRPVGAGGAQLRPAGPDGVGLDLGAVTSALPKYPGNRRCPVHPSSIASRAARVEEERAHPRRPLA